MQHCTGVVLHENYVITVDVNFIYWGVNQTDIYKEEL